MHQLDFDLNFLRTYLHIHTQTFLKQFWQEQNKNSLSSVFVFSLHQFSFSFVISIRLTLLVKNSFVFSIQKEIKGERVMMSTRKKKFHFTFQRFLRGIWKSGKKYGMNECAQWAWNQSKVHFHQTSGNKIENFSLEKVMKNEKNKNQFAIVCYILFGFSLPLFRFMPILIFHPFYMWIIFFFAQAWNIVDCVSEWKIDTNATRTHTSTSHYTIHHSWNRNSYPFSHWIIEIVVSFRSLQFDGADI